MNDACPQRLKAAIDFAGIYGTAEAVPFPFVLNHSSWVSRRRGKPRLYATFLRRLCGRALSKQIQTDPLRDGVSASFVAILNGLPDLAVAELSEHGNRRR